jgi:23S rRNA U2552 (ribose-2'-O)-methylase RlmE/FtsJ
MKSRFSEFRRIKPLASRKESREIYYFGRNGGGGKGKT